MNSIILKNIHSLKNRLFGFFFLIAFFVAVTVSAQNDAIQLKYLGTAGWQITDGNITVLVDPYISRVKLGTGPGVSPEDNRKTVDRSDRFVSHFPPFHIQRPPCH